MISITNTELLDGDSEITWLFKIVENDLTTFHYLSTKSYTYDGQLYLDRIVPNSFKGVKMSRPKSEIGIIPSFGISFDIENIDNHFDASNFDETCWMQLSLCLKKNSTEEIVRTWYFLVDNPPDYSYGSLKFSAEDYTQKPMRSLWPKTALMEDIFKDEITYSQQSGVKTKSNLCVPKVFGTAYVPIVSVYCPVSIQPNRRLYVLGERLDRDGAPSTFTVTRCHTPSAYEAPGEWIHGTGAYSGLTVDCTNPNSDVTFQSITKGALNNMIGIAYLDSGATDCDLSINVSGLSILITLKKVASAITTIANDIVTAVNAHDVANELVMASRNLKDYLVVLMMPIFKQ